MRIPFDNKNIGFNQIYDYFERILMRMRYTENSACRAHRIVCLYRFNTVLCANCIETVKTWVQPAFIQAEV